MLIISCDNFSDLWDGHVKQLEKYWPDRNMDTYIVTESISVQYGSVKTLPVGDIEWSDRLKAALDKIDTKYVFITLDDYFLVDTIDDKKLQSYLEMMKKNAFDYFRLYKRPKRDKNMPFQNSRDLFLLDAKARYAVNLYPAIWKKDFLFSTVREGRNAWQYEVSLLRVSSEYGAKCIMTNANDFPILDVVRKGKLLHSSARYFKKHQDIYSGNRETNTWFFETRLFIKTWAVRILPNGVSKIIRRVFSRFGYHFYSEEMDSINKRGG